jgi:hypothetical protein
MNAAAAAGGIRKQRVRSRRRALAEAEGGGEVTSSNIEARNKGGYWQIVAGEVLLKEGEWSHQYRRELKSSGTKKSEEPAKKVSLASKFNAVGGNNVMWEHSVLFLAHMGVIDFHQVLQYHAPLERAKCLYSQSVFSPGAGSRNFFLANMLDSIKLSLQLLYDKECGVLLCNANDNL